MPMKLHVLIAGASVALVLGCSGDNSARVAEVRTALDKTQMSLGDMVLNAENTRTDPQEVVTAKMARLVANAEPTVVVQASFASTVKEVQLDRSGKVLSVAPIGGAPDGCAGPVTARDAIAIAERESGGRAFQIQPDDDEPCLFEVQALQGSKIWEVKIDRNGKVIEKEDATDDVDDD